MYDKITNLEDEVTVIKKDVDVLKTGHQEHAERLDLNEKTMNETKFVVTNLENTILKGNQSTQEFFRDLTNKQWDLITARDISKEKERNQAHQIAVTNQEIKKSNWAMAWEWLGKTSIAGGILYLVIDKFFV